MSILGSSNLNELTIEKIDERKKFLTNQLSSLNIDSIFLEKNGKIDRLFYNEENIFQAYEKHHSTTKSVSEVMNKLNIKNIILYHTEDSHKEQRKELYTKEAEEYFNGNVIVPNDFEELILIRKSVEV